MRGNKKLVQGIAVAGAAGVLVFTVTFSQPQIMQTEGTIQITENGTAGIMAALNPDRYMGDILTKTVTVADNHVYQVSAGIPAEKFIIDQQAAVTDERASIILDDQDNEYSKFAVSADTRAAAAQTGDSSKETADNSDTDQKNTNKKENNIKNNNKKEDNKKDSTNKKEKKAEEKDQSEKQKKWANKLIADVDDYLNIRSASNEGSKVVGKLRKGDVAKVIKKGKIWTKIKSGSVTGYVHNEYCLYGSKAYKLAKKICNTYATVKADGLRIRKQANKDATVLEAAFKGDKLVVNTKAKPKDGWVIVNFDDQKGFVADEYVKVSLGSEAISIEEEKAQIAASQKVTPSSSSSPSSNSTAASSSQSVSSSDLTLLSAIIFCEAGGESYSGQVAVGAVVMNRVKSSSFPNSISGVVYQSGQFSPVANGALARALSNGNYQHCISAAQAALAGNDNTGGAKFFHRANGAAGLILGNPVFY